MWTNGGISYREARDMPQWQINRIIKEIEIIEKEQERRMRQRR